MTNSILALAILGLVLILGGSTVWAEALSDEPTQDSLRVTKTYAGFQLVAATATTTSYAGLWAIMGNNIDSITASTFVGIGLLLLLPVLASIINYTPRLVPAALVPFLRQLKPGFNSILTPTSPGAAATA